MEPTTQTTPPAFHTSTTKITTGTYAQTDTPLGRLIAQRTDNSTNRIIVTLTIPRDRSYQLYVISDLGLTNWDAWRDTERAPIAGNENLLTYKLRYEILDVVMAVAGDIADGGK